MSLGQPLDLDTGALGTGNSTELLHTGLGVGLAPLGNGNCDDSQRPFRPAHTNEPFGHHYLSHGLDPAVRPSSPWWKSAPLPSRPGHVLKLLSHERKRPVFSDFHHGLLVIAAKTKTGKYSKIQITSNISGARFQYFHRQSHGADHLFGSEQLRTNSCGLAELRSGSGLSHFHSRLYSVDFERRADAAFECLAWPSKHYRWSQRHGDREWDLAQLPRCIIYRPGRSMPSCREVRQWVGELFSSPTVWTKARPSNPGGQYKFEVKIAFCRSG